MSKPVDWIVFKVVQICNLNCTYCYVYNRGDDSWSRRPKFVSEHVVERLIHSVNEHCKKNSISVFNIELHGGEPLLLGIDRMRRLLTMLQEGIEANVVFHLQTNGLLLDEHWVNLFDEFAVGFGISMDGPPDLADRFRVYHSGKGSTRDLSQKFIKLSQLPAFQRRFGGALCVVSDPTVSPKELLDWFIRLGVDRIDFLLPDGNYANPPPGFENAAPFTRFLTEAFNTWVTFEGKAPRVRMFEYMLFGMTGEEVSLDALGGNIEQLAVIESDGSIGVSDVARICAPLSEDQISIFTHDLDARANQYNLSEIQQLSQACASCEFLSSCGGGYLAHRFDGNSFTNPSWYCESLFSLSKLIYDQVSAALLTAK